jgi:hypothetical protein
MNPGIGPRHELPIEPNHAFALIEGNNRHSDLLMSGRRPPQHVVAEASTLFVIFPPGGCKNYWPG